MMRIITNRPIDVQIGAIGRIIGAKGGDNTAKCTSAFMVRHAFSSIGGVIEGE